MSIHEAHDNRPWWSRRQVAIASLVVALASFGCTPPPQAPLAHSDEATNHSSPLRGLSPEQIRSTVVLGMSRWEACYNRYASGLAGKFSLSFSVAPSGQIDAVSMVNDTFSRSALTDCALDVARSLSFPPADLPTKAVFPFSFHPPTK